MSNEMSPAAQRVMGAMKQLNRMVMPSEFLKEYRAHFTAGLPMDKNDEPAFRPETWAVIQLDVGIKQCQEAGLIDWTTDMANQKVYFLTDRGKEAVGL